MKWWIFGIMCAVVLGIYTLIDIPLWHQCKAAGFSNYYCFFQLK